MADSLQRILADAKAGKLSCISALSEDDVANVWENVATYIEQKMGTQKGVHIPNFGTFSFSQNKLDVGNNKYVMMQRPVFNISEKFAQTHCLQFTKYNVPGADGEAWMTRYRRSCAWMSCHCQSAMGRPASASAWRPDNQRLRRRQQHLVRGHCL
eukprot:TRINITY_DN16656_c0_g1_i5.p3 TRINITY_DN16656_c0_g1~~TRINITY_DN16656_c0_g1_i5.p3  ORF type:complete len:155 (+),score=23.79 TRINITY_DN16656_c0_g1_i5:1090-1554(+)